MITQDELNKVFSTATSIEAGDKFHVTLANGQCVMLTAELVRAYLNRAFSLTINEDGYIVIGGVPSTYKAEGITPILRAGFKGIEVSYDKGGTYALLISYNQLARDGEFVQAPEFEAFRNAVNQRLTRVYDVIPMDEQQLEQMTVEDMEEGVLYIGLEDSDTPTVWTFGQPFPIILS